MLATYMRRMRNSNLEIRIARSSCRAQLAFWKKKTIGIIFNWDISTTHAPPPNAELERKFQKLLSFSAYKTWQGQIWCFNCY